MIPSIAERKGSGAKQRKRNQWPEESTGKTKSGKSRAFGWHPWHEQCITWSQKSIGVPKRQASWKGIACEIVQNSA